MSFTYLTSSGAIFTGQGALLCAILTAGADAASLTIKDANNVTIAVIKAAAGETVPVPLCGVVAGGATATITGTSPSITVVWS